MTKTETEAKSVRVVKSKGGTRLEFRDENAEVHVLVSPALMERVLEAIERLPEVEVGFYAPDHIRSIHEIRKV